MARTPDWQSEDGTGKEKAMSDEKYLACNCGCSLWWGGLAEWECTRCGCTLQVDTQEDIESNNYYGTKVRCSGKVDSTKIVHTRIPVKVTTPKGTRIDHADGFALGESA